MNDKCLFYLPISVVSWVVVDAVVVIVVGLMMVDVSNVVDKTYVVVAKVLLFCTSCAEIRSMTINKLITIESIKYRIQPAGGSLNRLISHSLHNHIHIRMWEFRIFKQNCLLWLSLGVFTCKTFVTWNNELLISENSSDSSILVLVRENSRIFGNNIKFVFINLWILHTHESR